MDAAGNGEEGDRTAASEAGRGERRRRPMRRTRLSRPVSMAAGEAQRWRRATGGREREGMGAPFLGLVRREARGAGANWSVVASASRRGLCGPRCERAGWASGVFPPPWVAAVLMVQWAGGWWPGGVLECTLELNKASSDDSVPQFSHCF